MHQMRTGERAPGTSGAPPYACSLSWIWCRQRAARRAHPGAWAPAPAWRATWRARQRKGGCSRPASASASCPAPRAQVGTGDLLLMLEQSLPVSRNQLFLPKRLRTTCC